MFVLLREKDGEEARLREKVGESGRDKKRGREIKMERGGRWGENKIDKNKEKGLRTSLLPLFSFLVIT